MSAALLAVGAVVLVFSGAAHLRDRAALGVVMARHRVLPAGLRRLTSAALPVLQLALGLALLVTIGAGASGASFALGLGAAALFLAFALYLHRASRAPGAAGMPCGCGVGEAPLGVWVVARALLLAVLSGAGAIGGVTMTENPLAGAGSAGADGAVRVVVSAAAVLALVVAISVLPAARAMPRVGRGVAR